MHICKADSTSDYQILEKRPTIGGYKMAPRYKTSCLVDKVNDVATGQL